MARPKERTGDYERIALDMRKDLLLWLDGKSESRRAFIENLLEQAKEKENIMSNLTGWSCIYCGMELSGPQEGQEHQESGECTGTRPSGELVNIAYTEHDPLSREERDAIEARKIQARPTISPEEKAERLSKMPLRPGETQAMRDASVERLYRG